MKHLLSILILLGSMSVATSEEIHLGCYYKSAESVMSYEVDIDLEKNKLWMNSYLYNITLATDLNIVALHNSDPNERITLNRYTGELSLDYLSTEESEAVNNLARVYCKKLEQLF